MAYQPKTAKLWRQLRGLVYHLPVSPSLESTGKYFFEIYYTFEVPVRPGPVGPLTKYSQKGSSYQLRIRIFLECIPVPAGIIKEKAKIIGDCVSQYNHVVQLYELKLLNGTSSVHYEPKRPPKTKTTRQKSNRVNTWKLETPHAEGESASLIWVKGHSGCEWNTIGDKYAKQATTTGEDMTTTRIPDLKI